MILWTNLVKISILHGKIHFIFFHSFNPYLESLRSTSGASEYQRDSVFIATISGSVSIRTFLPQSLFGTVSMNVYINNICLVSPLLLQPILANTLGLTRLLAQGRRHSKKRGSCETPCKGKFLKARPVDGKGLPAWCACIGIQRQERRPVTGVGFPVWAGLLSRGWHGSLSLWGVLLLFWTLLHHQELCPREQ